MHAPASKPAGQSLLQLPSLHDEKTALAWQKVPPHIQYGSVQSSQRCCKGATAQITPTAKCAARKSSQATLRSSRGWYGQMHARGCSGLGNHIGQPSLAWKTTCAVGLAQLCNHVILQRPRSRLPGAPDWPGSILHRLLLHSPASRRVAWPRRAQQAAAPQLNGSCLMYSHFVLQEAAVPQLSMVCGAPD